MDILPCPGCEDSDNAPHNYTRGCRFYGLDAKCSCSYSYCQV